MLLIATLVQQMIKVDELLAVRAIVCRSNLLVGETQWLAGCVRKLL
jgi:hypothetical protein